MEGSEMGEDLSFIILKSATKLVLTLSLREGMEIVF